MTLSTTYTKIEIDYKLQELQESILSLGGGGGGDLSNYYTKSETYSRTEIDDIIEEITDVDTSNLVPYNNATKNVNIGAYYFESSAGFKTPNGTANQSLTANGGVFDLNTKADLVDGKIPSSQLPSYVDDVLEFANLASFPATGESGKIYIAIDTNITYRWGGSSYVIMTSSLALGETSSTAYRGDRGKIAYDHSQTTGNPHGTTKTDIGLGNVDNTSDLNKPISTATQQALNNKLDKGTYTGNASDLKSLIDTKADLVGGKVPASQSQPSTMVMNSSTYVITFTDATGTVQTIDLPLESLFKDANYNSSTKSLIVTLQDGTTRTIPLTDLVDLPEIVLATDNPAVTPTTGQKVYFNTDLGKVWFNVSGTWTYAGNLISDSEKANITTAYNHSQATGNPHGTKLEELSDISGTDTTIADTDEILKKENGGFWRKITWANIKANLKTYFDNLYAPKSFNVKVTTPSSWVTGTTSETEVLRIEIPANSISNNSFLNMPILYLSKIGKNGNMHIKGKLSTSPTMPTGGTDQIFGYTNIGATNLSFGMDRMYIVSGGLIKGFPFTVSSYSSSSAHSSSFSSKVFDRTVTNYLYVSIELVNTSDQARLEGIQLTNS